MEEGRKMRRALPVAAVLLLITAAIVLADSTGNRSPTACSGQWTGCSSANADGGSVATAAKDKAGVWNNYGFSFGAGDIIGTVKVRADFFASRTNGYIDVKVSGDGGASYGPVHTVGGNTAEQTFIIDVTGDAAWDASKLSNANFRVNVTCRKIGGGPNPTCNLDWIPVEVTFTPFDFSVSVDPSSGTVASGGTATTNVTVTHLQGNPQTVYLFSTCVENATCIFNPSSGTPTYGSLFTVNTTNSSTGGTTPPGTYNITIQGISDGGKVRNANYVLTVT